MITNNSGQTLIVSSGKPKMGEWEKALDSQLANDGTTKGIVSNVHVCVTYVCHAHTDWYPSSAIDQRTKCAGH